jgi:ubiquinone/menaquinone biosynthesis C-methylase UbiE
MPMSDQQLSDPADRIRAHYGPLFARFKTELRDGTLEFETECLAFELNQIPDIPDPALVLDGGCGTGRYSGAWHRLFPSATLVGVDINRPILTTGLLTDALSPINGNLEALPFKSGSFDVVMSRGALPATPDPRRAMRELLRVCKPGGLFFFYTYRYGWFDVLLSPLRLIAKLVGAPLCKRVIYGICGFLRLDPRVPAMMLDELFAPIRNAPTEKTILEWLHTSGTPLASIRPVVHAQYGNIRLPVDRRTAWLLHFLPKIDLISLAVVTAKP